MSKSLRVFQILRYCIMHYMQFRNTYNVPNMYSNLKAYFTTRIKIIKILPFYPGMDINKIHKSYV